MLYAASSRSYHPLRMNRAVTPNRRRFDEDRLLDAAREVFHADGFVAAQIADIAKQAGTTRPTLHARLGNKDQIYARVVRREADVFRSWIADAYACGRELPLHDLADVGMEPIFRFAAERPAGFNLLLRGDTAGERPRDLRREALDDVTGQLTELIDERQKKLGPPLGPVAASLAAACVGVAVHTCEHAMENGHDLDATRRLAARFVDGAFRHIDLNALSPELAARRSR